MALRIATVLGAFAIAAASAASAPGMQQAQPSMNEVDTLDADFDNSALEFDVPEDNFLGGDEEFDSEHSVQARGSGGNSIQQPQQYNYPRCYQWYKHGGHCPRSQPYYWGSHKNYRCSDNWPRYHQYRPCYEVCCTSVRPPTIQQEQIKA